jgi:hypothetical protein
MTEWYSTWLPWHIRIYGIAPRTITCAIIGITTVVRHVFQGQIGEITCREAVGLWRLRRPLLTYSSWYSPGSVSDIVSAQVCITAFCKRNPNVMTYLTFIVVKWNEYCFMPPLCTLVRINWDIYIYIYIYYSMIWILEYKCPQSPIAPIDHNGQEMMSTIQVEVWKF